MPPIPPIAAAFAERLRNHPADDLEAFAETEIHSGIPHIFGNEEDYRRFQRHVAAALGIAAAAEDVMIVGSARMSFSLDPDRAFIPFGENSDIDVAVVHAGLFETVWHTMLTWDYLTAKARGAHEQQWLRARQNEIWSGWCEPPRWYLRETGGIQLSFPASLKPLRDFSYRWFTTFRSLSRYRDHREIPRHRVTARLYRSRRHAAMYHALGLRRIRAQLVGAAPE